MSHSRYQYYTALSFFLLSVLLLITCVASHSHDCMHNEIANSEAIRNMQKTPLPFATNGASKRSVADTANQWNPIRITFYFDGAEEDVEQRSCYKAGDMVRLGNPSSTSTTCGQQSDGTYLVTNCWDTCKSSYVITEEKLNHMKTVVIPNLKSKMEKMLNVSSLADNVLIPEGNSACVDENNARFKLPAELSDSGINSDTTDLAILVTLRPKRSGTGISGGYAFHCKVESQFNRPVLGVLNLHPMNVMEDDVNADIVQHELIHVLAFSPSLYDSFIDENGNKRTTTTKKVAKSVTGYDGSKTVVSINRIVTPEVQAQVREHFNCSSAEGADLEEYGSRGTAGAHWEMRIFMNEMMTGSDEYTYYTNFKSLSKFTLALLQDSGWYRIRDWNSNAQTITWGYNTGCTMLDLTKRCENWGSLNNHVGYSCSESDQNLNFCTNDHTSIGYCNIVTYKSPLSTEYQHFQNVYKGGKGILPDYCPLIQRVADTTGNNIQDCRNPDNSKTKTSGEYFGNESACFHSNAAPKATGEKQDAKCFKYSCEDDRLSIQIGSTVIACPVDQSYQRITTGLPSGFGGYVDCPADGYTLLCGSYKVPAYVPTGTSAASTIHASQLCLAVTVLTAAIIAMVF